MNIRFMIFIGIFFLLGYNVANATYSIKQQQEQDSYNISKKPIFFDDINIFLKNRELNNSHDSLWQSKHYKIQCNGASYSCKLLIDDIIKLTMELSKEEPVDFNIFSYESALLDSYKIVLIEGVADIGTSWYYIIILKFDNVIDYFYIDEPRSDSDIHLVSDFISIYYENNMLTFRFKKKLLGRYSEIPKNYKRDKNYVYLFKKLPI